MPEHFDHIQFDWRHAFSFHEFEEDCDSLPATGWRRYSLPFTVGSSSLLGIRIVAEADFDALEAAFSVDDFRINCP